MRFTVAHDGMSVLIVDIFCSFFFFFNDTATTEIYTLSLHDALPILRQYILDNPVNWASDPENPQAIRSEEHTSELQSQSNLVCRLLLEKKKKKKHNSINLSKQHVSLFHISY